MKILLLLLLCLTFIACDNPSTSTLSEAMNPDNDPANLPGAVSSLDHTYRTLPIEGYVSRVWTGWWWPMSEGGTASRRYGHKSPMEKYDEATGTSAYRWEVTNSEEYKTTSWAGHCNGVAASGIMEEEPVRSVTYNGVTFSIADIKALLAEMWQGSGWIIGDKCNLKNPTYNNYGRIEEPECRDLNPATFHIAITNFLGLFGKALILDIDNSDAVWNYPAYEYKYEEIRWYTVTEAANILHRGDGTSYTYNLDAVDIVHVRMTLMFAGAGKRVYDYFLELDLEGMAIGGEWYRGSKKNHPDFIWRPQDPKAYNPFLDLDVVRDIYFQSI